MKIFGIQVGQKTLEEMAIDEAMLLVAEQRYDEAIQVIETKALGRNPDDRRALLHLGICCMLKGDYDKAESVLKPLVDRRGMDSEKAAALIAMDKVAALRAGTVDA